MKSLKNFKIKAILLLMIACLIPTIASAEGYKKYYANGDWQFNGAPGNSFATRASGWGMNFEGGWFFSPKCAVGLFIAYSTNHKYIEQESISLSNNGTLTTNQQRSLFQLPFGAAFRYRFNTQSWLDPYVALKVGAEYVQLSSYISTFQVYQRNWGFYVSPEIGSDFWINPNKNFGFHVAVYYGFSTNKGAVLNGDIDKLNNVGFRLGLAF